MVKKHGAVYQTKIFCDETKILSGIWTADHGRDNRRHEIADFNCIDNSKRCFIDLNCIEIIYNLDKIYPIGVFVNSQKNRVTHTHVTLSSLLLISRS